MDNLQYVTRICIAVLLGGLIFVKGTKKKAAYAIFIVILFVGLFALSKALLIHGFNADTTRADIESALNEIPSYANIKKYAPGTYQSLIDEMVNAEKKGYNDQQVADLVGSKMSALVDSRIPHASDGAVIAYTQVMVTQMGELQGQGGGLCYKHLFPQSHGDYFDLYKSFSQETRKKSSLAFNETIKTFSTKRGVPPESEVMPDLKAVYANLHAKYGDDVFLLDNPAVANTAKEKDTVCSIKMDMYKEILRFPPEKAASMMRWMLAQKKDIGKKHT